MAGRLSISRKFSIAYFALAALVGGAIGTFIILVERPAPIPPPPWSAWQPVGSDKLVRAQEIGTHVAAQYHLASGKRLVRVVVGAPGSEGGDPIQAIFIAKTVPAKQSDLVSYFPAKGTMMYILCGDGPKCAINEGKASTARGAVIRREALELALYTFRYVKDVDSVVAFSPPKKGNLMTLALYFDKTSFSSQLHRPLHKTLAVPPAKVTLAPSEKKTVDLLTSRRVLHFALQRANGARILVLARNGG